MLDLYIGLGGNLGDRAGNLAQARAQIDSQFPVLVASGLYETPALMPANAPESWNIPFLNQVLHARSDKDPAAILSTLKAIEKTIGRAPAERWAPRVIDIDIIAYGNHYLKSDTLYLPHASMHTRDFVLQPLCDIAPDWCYPAGSVFSGKTARELLESLPYIEVKPYAASH